MTQADNMDYDEITGEKCPICGENQLTLFETVKEIPFFGMCHIFSMDCLACKYHKGDVEAEEDHGKVTFTLNVDCEEDMNIRIVRSSTGTVKLGTIGSIEAGETANGYITNVEGLLTRMQKQIESLRDVANAEGDSAAAKKCKNALKKITRVMWGQEPMKLVIKDPTGNSAIISEKATKEKK